MATAYAALVSLLNDLELVKNHPRHSFSFDNNQIQSLLKRVLFLIDFLETCDNHGATEALENKIAVAAHAAADVILSHVADQIHSGSTLRERRRSPRFIPDQIRIVFSLTRKTRSSSFQDMQKAIEDMDLQKEIEDMNLQKVQSTPSTTTMATPSTPLTSQKNTMVGFDEVLHELLELLTREGGERVIPIIAMGGAGKTTLARNAFRHKVVLERFDVCLWATVSQQYDVERILEELLSCLCETASGVADLGEKLHKSLYGMRYLIVLDDLWTLDAWDKIKLYLPDEFNGSRIIVTSRQFRLVDHLTSSSFIRLDLLDKENSWILFCEKVFGDKQDCPPELEVVGHKIVKKCRGLPLAIVVVGGHLRNSLDTQEYWEKVAKNMVSVLSSDENKACLDILYLSYSCLPVQLKPCFLYMGILKEDQSIDASSLIKLWIGEGFIKPSKTQSLEETAEGCLKDLVDRNLILACKRNLDGKTVSCELHDIVRELCLTIGAREKFLCVIDAPQAVHMERRVVYHERTPHIRSLRVLNEVDGEFLDADCHQVNLRHIGCFLRRPLSSSWSQSFNISPSISLLWSLQTLIVRGHIQPVALPDEFWEMLQLRHLETDKNTIILPDPSPSDSGRLVQGNLQTLSVVENLRLSEEVCKRISNIRELRIKYNYLVSDEVRHIYYLHNLRLLHKLESLECSFGYGQEWSHFVLNSTFPDSLKELKLTSCHLSWDQLSQMAGSLPHLETLILSFNAVSGSHWNTIEGHFNSLKSLTIQNCVSLVKFNVGNSHFPALECLILLKITKLDELPSCIGESPSLQLISLSDCSVSLLANRSRYPQIWIEK